MQKPHSFSLFYLLILLLSPIKAQLPVDTILFPSSCGGSDSNCPSYRYARCGSSSDQCKDCNNAGDCDHLTGGSGGDCRFLSVGNTFCYVSCSSGSSPCLAMRAICDTSSGSSSTYYCNQCSSNSDCTSQGYSGTVYCDKTTVSGFGVCSSCPSTGCTVGSCQNFKCVQCTSNSGCSSPTPYCIKKFEGNFCKQCLANSDCTSNSALSKCDTSTNTCVKCSGTSDCSLITGKPYCSSTLGCVQCLGNGNCSGATPYCSPAGTCSQCTDSTNCASPALPYCSASYSCTTCTSFPGVCGSRYPSTLPYCATAGVNNGACVRCTQNSHCSAPTSICSNSNTCVQCTANTQCSRTTPICSGSNTCSVCTDSSVCSSLYSPSYPYCATTGSNTGACVRCTQNSHCSGTTPYCSSINTCVACAGDSNCNALAPYCSTVNYVCTACTDSTVCATQYSSTLPYCALTGSNAGACVRCTQNSHCSGATPYCSSSNTCVQCLTYTACAVATPECSSSFTCTTCTSNTICSTRFPGTQPYCATTGSNTGTCVRCTQNSHCSGATPYCSSSNTCVACTSNSHCSSTIPVCSNSNVCVACSDATASVCSTRFPTTMPYCATTGSNTGACVKCTQNSQCSGSTPYCSSSNACVQCTSNSHCSSTAPYCSSSNVCTACPDSTVCAAQYPSTLPYCATSGINTGACVRCLSNTNCPAATSYCSTSNTCVQCLTDSACPSTTPDCSASYSCIACTSSTICASRFPGTQPYCATTGSNTGACVRCTQNSHCSGSTPYCSSSNTCVACLTDSNCPLASAPICSAGTCQSCTSNPSICLSRFSALPVCYGGTCVECGTASDCPSNSPICLSNNCVECSTSTDCTSPANPSCSSSTNNCEGCPSSSFCNSKYPGSLPYCFATTGACVQCLANSDCSGATPFCSTSTKTCVQCLGDGDCPSISAPKCSVSNTCQPCTAYTGICASKFTYQPVCSGGNCVGCGSASDCSDPSKPVCETGAGACVQCITSSDCPSVNAPYCSSGTCQPCTNSPTAICPGKFPNAPVCYSDQCVECGDDADCLDSSKPNCMNMVCKATIYLSECSPQYNIQAYQTSDLNIFNLYFPSDLVAKTSNLPSVLSLTLLNVPSTDYTYIVTKLSDTNYQATFTFQATIPATELKITLPCPYQHGYSFGDIHLTIPTLKIAFTTPEVQQTMKAIQGVATTATTVMAGASGSMMVIGANPAIMWALIGLLQTFYYMIFINVQYPANVQAFFGLFTMGNLSFIPNPMTWFFPNIDNESLDAPSKFLENDVDGLFLQGGGNELLMWFVVIMGYILSKLFLTYTRNMPRLLSGSAAKTVSMFEWSGVLRTLITSYTQLAMMAFLQIRVMNFNETLFSLSSVTGILFTIFAFTFPGVVYWLIKKYRKSVQMMKIKYSTLIEEYKYEPSEIIPQYFTVFFLVRRLVLCLTLVYSHDHPYHEIFFLISNCLIWLILLVKCRPYDTKINNFVNIISEVCFIGVHVLILLLIHGDYTGWLSEQKRLDIGWGIIGACGLILVMTLVASFVQQYYTMKKMIKLLIQVIEKNRKARKNRVKRIKSPSIYPMESVSRSSSMAVSSVGTIEQGYTARELLESSSSSFRGIERGSEPGTGTRIGVGAGSEPRTGTGIGMGSNYKVAKRVSMGDNIYKLGQFKKFQK